MGVEIKMEHIRRLTLGEEYADIKIVAFTDCRSVWELPCCLSSAFLFVELEHSRPKAR